MNILNEDSRQQLLNRSKSAQPEKQDNKTRYQKRLKSRISQSVSQYNDIDMNKLFKNNIFSVGVKVRGETDNYVVLISFGELLDEIKYFLSKNNYKLEAKVIIQALTKCFNNENVYIHCSCPDWEFRMAYWATRNKINSGEPQYSNGKWIRNPDDKLGPGCKHSLLVLSNADWIIKSASVILNYIRYAETNMQSAYARLIYPKIYDKEYQKDVQLSLIDTDELDNRDIERANKYAKTKTQFQKGNEYRYQKQDKPSEDQLTLEDE